MYLFFGICLESWYCDENNFYIISFVNIKLDFSVKSVSNQNSENSSLHGQLNCLNFGQTYPFQHLTLHLTYRNIK